MYIVVIETDQPCNRKVLRICAKEYLLVEIESCNKVIVVFSKQITTMQSNNVLIATYLIWRVYKALGERTDCRVSAILGPAFTIRTV